MDTPDAPAPVRILTRADGSTIAYARTPGAGPGVIFLGGFASDMTGTKATALESFCRQRGRAFLRFDYSGHGQSSGAFVEGCIGRWAEDARAVLDALTSGPQILVGSSMGGWIMLLVARSRPERIAGLVGIAAAPDFTEDLMWGRFEAADRERLTREGMLLEVSRYGPTPYPITRKLIEEGRNHLLLRGALPIGCPVRLLHGMADPDVPWQVALRLSDRLAGGNVALTLIKDGDHRLSRPQDLQRIFAAVEELSAPPA